jgi:hypothetical protein
VRSSDLTLPEIGSSLTLGTSYNSLLVGSDVPTGSNGYGWRTRAGADVQLKPGDNGSEIFLGADGTAGDFTTDGSTMYNSPSGALLGGIGTGVTCVVGGLWGG